VRYLRWVMARLAGPHAGRTVTLIALALALPALFSGLSIDDYIQMVRWKAGLWRFLDDCFVFIRGDAASIHREFCEGLGIWWTALDSKTAFWRPVAAATHAVDLLFWPENSVLMHLHTLLWFVALLLALGVLYRRFFTARVVSLALALYAWDDARGQVLSWIAKRNALIAGVFGVCTLIAYDRWRRDGWRPGGWLAPLLLALGLLSAEAGIATAGFLFAYALYVDRGALVRRLVRLVPHGLVVVAWQATYVARGYGVEASAAYIHPLHEPLAYATQLFVRAPLLALGQLTPIASDFWGMYSPVVKVVVLCLTAAVLVIVARIGWPRLAADPHSRFWLAGAGLSLLPVSSSAASDTNLGFVGIGAAPLLAAVFVSYADDPPAATWPRFVVGALALFNLLLGPLLLPPKCLTMLGMGYGLARADESIPRDPGITTKTLVVVTVFSEGGPYATLNYRDAKGIPKPGRTRLLATTFRDVSVTRPDEVTLRLRPDGGFLAHDVHRLARGPSRPFHAGDVVELSNMTARVTEITTDGRPRTVEFRFRAPLESPEWLWMRGQGFGLVSWTPPRVGETVVLPASF
jgi:hypothetical protein